jgi:hypothetical protein
MSFTYEDCVKQFARRRKGSSRKKVHRSSWIDRNSDGSFNYVMWDTNLVTIHPGSIYELHYTSWVSGPTTKMRYNQILPGNTLIYHDRELKREQKMRVKLWVRDKMTHVPYTEGLRIDSCGRLLNPEIVRDFEIKLDRKVAKEIQDQIRPFYKAGLAMLRMGVTDEDIPHGFHYRNREIDINQMLDPDFESDLVYRVVATGIPPWKSAANVNTTSIFQNAVRKARERLYRQAGAYFLHPISIG